MSNANTHILMSDGVFKIVCKNKSKKFLTEIKKIAIIENNTIKLPEQKYLQLIEAENNTPSRSVKDHSTTNIDEAYPSLIEDNETLIKSLNAWAASGFNIVDIELFNKRLDVCRSCKHWDQKALYNIGSCDICGCATQAKLRLKTEMCPLSHWPSLE